MSARQSSEKSTRAIFSPTLRTSLVVVLGLVAESALCCAPTWAQDGSATHIVCIALVGSSATGRFQTNTGIPTDGNSDAIDSCTTADGQQGIPSCPDPTAVDDQGNYIPWPGVCVVTRTITRSKGISFDNGTAVGGITTLSISPDGSWEFSGWVRDDGLPSYNVTTVGVVHTKSGQGFSITVSGHLAGALESGSNRLDWDQSGTNETLKNLWNEVDYVSVGYSVSLDAAALVNETMAVAGTVTGIISLVP